MLTMVHLGRKKRKIISSRSSLCKEKAKRLTSWLEKLVMLQKKESIYTFLLQQTNSRVTVHPAKPFLQKVPSAQGL